LTLRLNPLFRYAIYGAFAALFFSGALWLLADGLKDSPAGETWQAVSANLLMVHGGAAMVTLMLLGALVPVHGLRAWRARKNRITGTAMASLNAVLIVTAYGLYYFGSEHLRPWLTNIHLAAGCALPIQLIFHIYLGRRRYLAPAKPSLAASGANLTFKSHLPHARAQMSNSKAPLDSKSC
jgi:hypothetical protein